MLFQEYTVKKQISLKHTYFNGTVYFPNEKENVPKVVMLWR